MSRPKRESVTSVSEGSPVRAALLTSVSCARLSKSLLVLVTHAAPRGVLDAMRYRMHNSTRRWLGTYSLPSTPSPRGSSPRFT